MSHPIADAFSEDDTRPELRALRAWSEPLTAVIHQCWQTHAASRLPFAVIDTRLAAIRRQFGWNGLETASPQDEVLTEEDEVYEENESMSPSMWPNSQPPSLPRKSDG